MSKAKQNAYRKAHQALVAHRYVMNVDLVITPEEQAEYDALFQKYEAAGAALSAADWEAVDTEIPVRFDQNAAVESCGYHAPQ